MGMFSPQPSKVDASGFQQSIETQFGARDSRVVPQQWDASHIAPGYDMGAGGWAQLSPIKRDAQNISISGSGNIETFLVGPGTLGTLIQNTTSLIRVMNISCRVDHDAADAGEVYRWKYFIREVGSTASAISQVVVSRGSITVQNPAEPVEWDLDGRLHNGFTISGLTNYYVPPVIGPGLELGLSIDKEAGTFGATTEFSIGIYAYERPLNCEVPI